MVACALLFFQPSEQNAPGWRHCFQEYLCQHIEALISYKRAAESNEVQGEAEGCTAKVLESLLEKYFLFAMHPGPGGLRDKGFEWLGNQYEVQARDIPFVRSGFFFV